MGHGDGDALVADLDAAARDKAEARQRPEIWGNLVESAVGAHHYNSATRAVTELFYWQERGREVDYVMRSGRSLVAFEVKSVVRRRARAGLDMFAQAFSPDRTLLVGGDGVPLGEFLTVRAEAWL